MIVQNILLIVAVLGVMALGFFVMKRLDQFLDENRRRLEEEEKEQEQPREALTADPSDGELAERTRTHEEKRGNAHPAPRRDKDDPRDEPLDRKR